MGTNTSKLPEIEKNLNSIARTPTPSLEDLMKQVHLPTLKIVKYGRTEEDSSPQVELGSKLAMSVPGKMNTWSDHFAGRANSVMSGRLGNSKRSLDIDAGPTSRSPGVSSPQRFEATRNYSTPRERPLSPPEESDTEYEEIDPYTGMPIVESKEIDTVMSDMGFDEQDGDGGVSLSDFDGTSDLEIIDAHTGIPIPAKSFKPAPQQLTFIPHSSSLKSLQHVFVNMDMKDDPYVLHLLNQDIEVRRIREKLQSALDGGTYSREHMKNLVTKATHLWEECGTWAADWFIAEAVNSFLQSGYTSAMTENGSVSDEEWEEESSLGIELREHERLYLRSLLQRVELKDPLDPLEGNVTDKVNKLIDTLLEEYETHQDFSGIVFAQQRVTVVALAEILRRHPCTKDVFSPGFMLGASTTAKKKSKIFPEMLGKKRVHTLDGFRTGELNLVVATSVIEEGLDIQACCSVICFSPPSNLKSFVQRRGRARRVDSSYVIMLSASETNSIKKFEAAEKEMIRMYQDETRSVGEVDYDGDEEEDGCDRHLSVPNTQ
jgi:hypothetical protein